MRLPTTPAALTWPFECAPFQVGRLIQRMAAAGVAAPSTLPPSPLASSLPSTMAAGNSTMLAAAEALQADLDGLETVRGMAGVRAGSGVVWNQLELPTCTPLIFIPPMCRR